MPPQYPPAKPLPSRDELHKNSETYPVTLEGYDGYEDHEAQIVVVTYRRNRGGKLEEFAVMLQIRRADTDEGWIDVERIDFAHGTVHVDRYDGDGNKTKDYDAVPPECRDDHDAALRWALGYIWDLERRLGDRHD